VDADKEVDKAEPKKIIFQAVEKTPVRMESYFLYLVLFSYSQNLQLA